MADMNITISVCCSKCGEALTSSEQGPAKMYDPSYVGIRVDPCETCKANYVRTPEPHNIFAKTPGRFGLDMFADPLPIHEMNTYKWYFGMALNGLLSDFGRDVSTDTGKDALIKSAKKFADLCVENDRQADEEKSG